MGLDQESATLEYTIFGVQTGPHKLSRVFNTDAQVQDALNRVKGFIERSQLVKKGLQITNLVRTQVAYYGLSSG
jgi:hypothetical protein